MANSCAVAFRTRENVYECAGIYKRTVHRPVRYQYTFSSFQYSIFNPHVARRVLNSISVATKRGKPASEIACCSLVARRKSNVNGLMTIIINTESPRERSARKNRLVSASVANGRIANTSVYCARSEKLQRSLHKVRNNMRSENRQ